MSPAQKQRFHAIRERYAAALGTVSEGRTGTYPDAPDTPFRERRGAKKAATPPAVSPAPMPARLRWEKPQLTQPAWTYPDGTGLPDRIPPRPGPRALVPGRYPAPASPVPGNGRKWESDLLAQGAFGRAPAWGLMGITGPIGRIRLWGAFRTRFTPVGGSYGCDSSGAIDGGGVFWGNGNARYGIRSLTAGPALRIAPHVWIYAGGGYGREELDWQDVAGNWACVRDYSRRGIALDSGCLLQGKRLSISAGCTWIAAPALTVGAGFRF